MERREFLEKVGAGAALALAVTCLGACSSNPTTPSGPVDFTIDLSQPAYTSLTTPGNYLITNGCVVAFGKDSVYYAATVICSHEGENVMYDKTNNNYYCNAHGARYSLSGSGLNTNGSKGLTTYTCDLSGTILRVHS